MQAEKKKLHPEYVRLADAMYASWNKLRRGPNLNSHVWEFGPRFYHFFVYEMPKLSLSGQIKGDPETDRLFGLKVSKNNKLAPREAVLKDPEGVVITTYVLGDDL